MPRLFKIIKAPVDFIVTLILWTYFICGYIVFYLPILFLMSIFIRSRETMFQNTSHLFYRGFFFLLRFLTPGLTLKISEDVTSLKSAVIVSNHRSYLDPLLLISLFPKHKTIVKGIFFKVPVMRWVMKSGGYIPYTPDRDFKDLMIEGIQGMQDFLRKGGIVFIFPEGKRSRDGRLGRFQKGAFSIAGTCNVPVEVLYLRNTDRLFTPGKFLFNTCVKNTISVERLGTIEPARGSRMMARDMRDQAVLLYKNKMEADSSL
jgi:1-acyl-sn-glycerol-3-phosphate acyltransferase